MKVVSFNRKLILVLIVLVCPASFFLAYVKTVDFLTAMGCALGSLAMLIVNLWDVHQDALALAQSRVDMAREMMEKGQLLASEECLKEALVFDPSNFDAIVVRGEIYRCHQQYEEARRELLKAYEINPQSFQVHFALGLTYLQEKKVLEAISEFKQTIKIKPEFSESYYILASAFELSGEKESALITYRKFRDIVTSDELKKPKIADYVEKTNLRIRVLS